MVSLINTAVPSQGQNTLFRKQVVEFESAQLEVEPWAMKNVVEANKDLLKVESARGIGGRKQVERDVLLESSSGVEVKTAQVKAGSGDALDRRTSCGLAARIGVNFDLAGAHAVPNWRDAEDDRPVAG